MEATLRQQYFAETFQDVEKLIYYTVHKFVANYGGDLEEQLAEGRAAFCKAYNRYDKTRCRTFTGYVHFFVWKHLLEQRRKRADKVTPANTLSVEHDNCRETIPEPACRFNLVDFLDELSDDARLVARLALDMPEELLESIRLRGAGIARRRQGLQQHLKSVGWTGCRIARSFSEIATVLKQFP